MVYCAKLGLLAAGSITLAIGVTLQVCADVAMVSGEAFVKALSMRLHKEFGLIKTFFDSSLVLIAVVLSFVWTGFSSIEGVREGTVVGALSIGPMVRFLLPRLQPRFTRFFTRHRAPAEQAAIAESHEFFPVITITRQYGCGGRKLGKSLAQDLGIKFYDNELIALIAKESGMSPQVVEKSEGRLDSALLYQMVMQDFSVPLEKSLSTNDALFVATSRAVRQVAKTSPCVIVGRGADKILQDNPRCIRVLLYADYEHKLELCRADYGQDKEQATESMRLQDRARAEYYLQYFGKDLMDPQNYQLCLNVGALGEKRCREIIASLYKAQAQALPQSPAKSQSPEQLTTVQPASQSAEKTTDSAIDASNSAPAAKAQEESSNVAASSASADAVSSTEHKL